MSEYRFVTRWLAEASLDRVASVLSRVEEWPAWWHGLRSVERVADGDGRGIGAAHRFTFRGALPYSLVFTMRVTTVAAPHRLAGEASGELVGTGTWTLLERATGTEVRYEWAVRTTRRWMNLLAPVARPLFARNHDLVMDWGRQGLARRLGIVVRRLPGDGAPSATGAVRTSPCARSRGR